MIWTITNQIVLHHDIHNFGSSIGLGMTAEWHHQLYTTQLHKAFPKLRRKPYVTIRHDTIGHSMMLGYVRTEYMSNLYWFVSCLAFKKCTVELERSTQLVIDSYPLFDFDVISGKWTHLLSYIPSEIGSNKFFWLLYLYCWHKLHPSI